MKILLLQPPIRDFYDTDIRLQPLGLCMLKAAVKNHLPDIQVVVKDYHQGWGRKTITYPAEFRYLKEYYQHHDKGPFSVFHHFYHFGAGFDEVAADVLKEQPDIVGISSLFSPYYREAIACARAVKGVMKDIPIIIGGPHASAMPHSLLKNPDCDYVIRGEGERPLVELLKALRNGGDIKDVPNLGYRNGSDLILNPIGQPYNFADLGWADFEDLSLNRYMLKNRPLCFIASSRGCPHACTFCSVHMTFGEGFRQRPIKDVIMEMEARYRGGYRVFDFEDDNLSFNREYFRGLLNLIISTFLGGDIQLTAMNGISYMALDSEILTLMKNAGFTAINLSLVSANEVTLKRCHRPHTLKKYLEVVKRAHELDLEIVTYQILGLPGENRNDMIETMVLMSRLPVLLGVSIFYLTPGSPISHSFPPLSSEDMVKSRSTAMAIETDQFERRDLYTLFITARIINFLKGIRTPYKEISLSEALMIADGSDKKGEMGADLLKRLLKEKRLYADTGNDMKVIAPFKTDLFFSVWERLSFIISQRGTRIIL